MLIWPSRSTGRAALGIVGRVARGDALHALRRIAMAVGARLVRGAGLLAPQRLAVEHGEHGGIGGVVVLDGAGLAAHVVIAGVAVGGRDLGRERGDGGDEEECGERFRGRDKQPSPPQPLNCHGRACPGHPDHMARPCPIIGVAGTSPAMTAVGRGTVMKSCSWSPRAAHPHVPAPARHSTVISADAVSTLPSSSVHLNSNFPLSLAVTKKLKNGFAAIAG